jgi:hypothetical protein
MLTHSVENLNELLSSLGFLLVIANEIITLKTLSFKFELCLTKVLKNIHNNGII